ncbi:MAG: PDZ domain-containing protein [Candidatus Acidiferrales bacterium]
MTSEGLDELVRVAWLGGDLGPAIYVTSGQPVAVRHKHLSGSFTYGLAWVERGSYLLVIDILRGSPAFKGSLRLGDKVASLNGVRIDHLTEQELAAMLYPQALDELEITIERAGSAATVTLKAAGISAVLRDVAEGEAWDTRPIHMALRTGP